MQYKINLNLMHIKRMELKAYTKYLIIGFIFILGGCNKESETNFVIKDNSEVTIKSTDGLYLCADRYQNNQIIANRKSLGEWEKYSIEILADNKIAIKASNYSYVGSSKGKEGLLVAEYPKIQKQYNFLKSFRAIRQGLYFKTIEIDMSA